jgi:hypothetical protein
MGRKRTLRFWIIQLDHADTVQCNCLAIAEAFGIGECNAENKKSALEAL